MPDEPNVTPPTQTPPPPANSPEARTETGELKTNPPPAQPSTPTDKSTTETTLAGKEPEAKPEPKPAADVPEKYEFKAPEGYEIDPAVIDEATPVLRELGITQEGAQKLFDIYSKHSAAGESKLIDAYEATRDGWRKEIVADKTIGDGRDGLSTTARQNISAAIDAMPEALRTPFRDAMNLTGAGDHPAFVRAWDWVGQQVREGTLVKGGNPSPAGQKAPGSGPRSAAQALYPSLPSSAS